MNIVWTMCQCYVWPNYEEHIEAGWFQGWCGRCSKPACMIYGATSKQEALDTFFVNYGHYPRPIVS